MPSEYVTPTALFFGGLPPSTGGYERMRTAIDELRKRLRGPQQNRAGRVPSGKIWPSGEFSLGYAQTPPDDDNPWQELGVLCPDGSTIEAWEAAKEGRRPLDLRNVPNSHRQPREQSQRGLKGITGFGRKMVRSAGALINRRPDLGPSTFATITMPPMPQQMRQKLVAAWPELVRQLMQRVSRQLERRGLPRVIVSVTELQTARLKDTGEAYPHLHLLWVNRRSAKKGSWSVDVSDLREWVHATLCRLLEYPSLGYVNIDVRPVRGSVAAYMSKYMSKGPGTIAAAAADWGVQMIASWWNMSAATRRWVKKNTMSGRQTGRIIEVALCHGWDASDLSAFIWIRQIELAYNSGIVNVGWRGCLTDQGRRDLTSLLKSE